MAKWITCKDDPSFYTCSNCNTLSDWRDKQCENCGEEMENTDDVIAEWGEYKALQYGGSLNVVVKKNGKFIMHAIRTERMTKYELTEYLKDLPEFLEMLEEHRKGRKNEGSQIKNKKRIRRR